MHIGHAWQFKPEGRALPVNQVGFIDAINAAQDAGVPIINAALVFLVEKGANDMPVGAVAENFFGKVADSLSSAVIRDNVASLYQQVKHMAKAFIELDPIIAYHMRRDCKWWNN